MSHLPPEPSADVVPEETPGVPLKILFVDDEPDLAPLIRQKFRRRVRKGELALDFAGDGQEALEKVHADPEIEVIVTDLNMPRMDGLTLLGHLDELDRRHKAVVVTAYGDMENIRTAMNKGAFDFLTKPIDMDDLQITLGQARRAVMREREADRLRDVMGTYLPPEVVEEILKNPDLLRVETREVSVLMSDLSGFSQISESLPPEQIVRLLNVYLSAMTDAVLDLGGIVDEFIGDAVLAIFGAPIAQSDHADRAVACAIGMQTRMDDVNAELADLNLPLLEMTAAVNTGEVVVGSIGSKRRAKYGVVGSPVNLTSRIQSKASAGEVLVSEDTRRAAHASLTVAETREAGLKGYTDTVPIHSVTAIDGPYASALSDEAPRYRRLREPLAFTFVHLVGKSVQSESRTGTLFRVSERGAEAILEGRVETRADLRLDLAVPGEEPTQIYAKALAAEPHDEGTRAVLRFTAVPPSLAAALSALASE